MNDYVRRSRWRTFRYRLYWAFRPLVLLLLRLLIGLRIEGLHNVPASGAALVIVNHLHNADPILLVAAFPRPLLFMAKKEAFAVPVIGWIADQAGAFPVDRGSADRAALRNAEHLLREENLVGIFPEGTRSTSGGLKQVYPGVAMIATRSGAPIIPTAIFGTESLPLNGKKGRRSGSGRPRVVVRIGKPFHLPPTVPGERRPSLDLTTDLMMVEIARLLPEQYRGIYADRVDLPQARQHDRIAVE